MREFHNEQKCKICFFFQQNFMIVKVVMIVIKTVFRYSDTLLIYIDLLAVKINNE